MLLVYWLITSRQPLLLLKSCALVAYHYCLRMKRSYVVFVDRLGPLVFNFNEGFWAPAFCWLLFWDTLYQLILGISSCSMKAATEQELRELQFTRCIVLCVT